MPQPLGEKFCGSAPMPASLKVFLSTVSDEFRAYRDQLRADLTRHNVEVKVQEDFKDLGGDTLDKLDVGQGADLLETRGWDDLACGVIVA
jgi:hypothetical protein